MVAAGLSAMIYEIAWTRMLVMVLGSSTYAFSCILMAFLLGITLGSFIFNLLSRKFTLGLRGFCLVEILIGVFSLVSLPTFSLLPRAYIFLFNALPPQISWSIQGLRFLIPVLIMVIPATLMGLAFPLAGAITKCVCKIYGANTLGNICGAILAGFFFLSLLGAQTTLKLAIIINLVLGVIGLLLKRVRFNPLLIGIVAFIIGLTIIQPRWDKYLMDSGVAVYTDSMSTEKSLEDRLYRSEMLFFKEGINAIVTVYQKSDGNRFLRINGKADASTNAIDMSTQLLLGHIPAILHPDPQNALVIGLGGGITANTVALFDSIRQVDCVEIEPAVVEAVHYFNHYNQNILQNGKIDLIVDDARSYLRKTDRSYDLIISEPSNPWIKGIGNLFTVEYYRLCRKSLNSRGIMCQWVQIYELSPDVLKMIVNSFRQAFPYCQLWFNPPGNAFILGSERPLTYNLESVDKKLDFVKLQNEVNRVELTMDSALSFLAYFELNNEEITEFSKGADLNSDNYPKLEFLAPYNLTVNTIIPNYKLIRSYKKHILPPNIRLNNRKISPDGYYYGLSKVYLKAGLSRQIIQYIHWAYYHINLALEINDRDARYYIVRGRINTAREAFEEAYADFSHSLELDSKNYEAYQELAYLFKKQGKWEKAQTYYQQALELEPQNEKLRSAYESFLDSWKKSRLSPDRDLTIPTEL
jgi:spermidine synthase